MPHFDRTIAKTARARFLRRQETDVEKLLWSRLRDGRLGYRFRRQHPAGPYILDFYSPALGLVIELDGSQHANGVQAVRDLQRDKWLSERGLKVLRFWNSDISQNLSGVLEHIKTNADEMVEKLTPTRRWRADLPLAGGGERRRANGAAS